MKVENLENITGMSPEMIKAKQRNETISAFLYDESNILEIPEYINENDILNNIQEYENNRNVFINKYNEEIIYKYIECEDIELNDGKMGIFEIKRIYFFFDNDNNLIETASYTIDEKIKKINLQPRTEAKNKKIKIFNFEFTPAEFILIILTAILILKK